MVSCWAVIVASVLVLALHPDFGVIYDRPGVALSLGFIGLGMCMHAREQARKVRGQTK